MKTTHPHNNANHHHQQPQKRSTSGLFSCAFFRHCTESPLSPTTPHSSPPSVAVPPPECSLLTVSTTIPPSPALLVSPPPPFPPLSPCQHPFKPSDSESSSSSTSQSFTQWRFPPTFPNPPPDLSSPPPQPPRRHETLQNPDLMELFHLAELHFSSGTDSDYFKALHMLEQSLVPNPPSDAVPESGASIVVPAVVVDGVVQLISQTISAKPATKVLLSLCLAEGNRRVAVACGAPSRVVDALPDLEGTVAERALAALELMCTVPEGAAEVRAHALAVPMLVATMGRMEGRGREYTISVLAAVYGGGGEGHQVWEAAPAEEVARAVVLAMQQGDCTARGKRKGAQLLKILQENGRVDLTQ